MSIQADVILRDEDLVEMIYGRNFVEVGVLDDSILKKSISHLRLGVRASKTLLRAGASTVGDVASLSRIDLIRQNQCGIQTVEEIRDCIKALGLDLRGEGEEKSTRIEEVASRLIDDLDIPHVVVGRPKWQRIYIRSSVLKKLRELEEV